jgi:hypothetical protein
MLVQGIKSRPRYSGLIPDPHAKRHLVAAEGDGALAVLDLAMRAGGDFLARLSLLYLPGEGHQAKLLALGADRFDSFGDETALLTALDLTLGEARMGTRLYATGTEGFIGLVVQLAHRHGIKHLSIRTEHRGSLARRVYCVHCKAITKQVTTNIVACWRCQAPLLVRDHYSRRLAAFMGVAVNAEQPDQIPPIEEIFP